MENGGHLDCRFVFRLLPKITFRCFTSHTSLWRYGASLSPKREPLLSESAKSDFFFVKKFIVSLFRTIFAFGNGQEADSLGFVLPKCLRSAFALPSLAEAKKRGRQTQGTVLPPLITRLRTGALEEERAYGIKAYYSHTLLKLDCRFLG